jgi:hypothetical protein
MNSIRKFLATSKHPVATLLVLLFLFLNLAPVTAAAQLPRAFVTGQQYIPEFIRDQQKANDKVEARGFLPLNDIDVPRELWPDRSPTLQITTFLVPVGRLQIFDSTGGEISKKYLVTINGKRYFKFLVHPLSLDFYEREFAGYSRIDELQATPLASHRSMVAWNTDSDVPDATMIKVSLDRIVGGVRRILSRGQLERAFAVSTLLKEENITELNRMGIYLIDEPLNVILKSNHPDGRDSGFSIRETVTLNPDERLVPMFSFYAQRGRRISDFARAVKKLGISPRQFAFEQIMKPMIDHLFHMAFQIGVIPDAHEQNVSVVLKNGAWTEKFYYLDLAGFYLNPQARKKAGKNTRAIDGQVDFENLLVERANIIEKIETYLVRSNFYAMANAIAKASGTDVDDERAWVQEKARNLMRGKVMALTGDDVQSARAQKTAITKYLNDYTVPDDIEREQRLKRLARNRNKNRNGTDQSATRSAPRSCGEMMIVGGSGLSREKNASM